MNFKDYANLTEKQQEDIVKWYHYAKDMGATDPGHAAAIAASHAFNLSNRAWNGKTGSNAFAAALAVLVMRKEINLSW